VSVRRKTDFDSGLLRFRRNCGERRLLPLFHFRHWTRVDSCADAMQNELEALLANPPSLSAVLEDRVMHKVLFLSLSFARLLPCGCR
jgi:hypothetical protein